MIQAVKTQEIVSQAIELITILGFKIITALLILLLGLWAAKGGRDLLKKFMAQSQIDYTVISFIGNLIYVSIITFVTIAALAQLGVQTASFVAVLGAAGLTVGLALQGSLSNFAAGILMIIFRPFKVNDYIEGAGVSGIVEELQIFTTTLKTPDHKTIIVPNGKLYADSIVNHSAKLNRRIDILLTVAYSTDIDHVKQVLTKILQTEPGILAEPAFNVAVVDIAANGIKIAATAWVFTPDYSTVQSDLKEKVKKSFDTEGIQLA